MRKSIAAISIALFVTACSSDKSESFTPPPNPPPPPPPTATISGSVTSTAGPVDAAALTSIVVSTPATDAAGSTANSDATGAYALSVPDGLTNYVEIAKAGLATFNSAFFSAPIDIAGVIIPMITELEANTVIGGAFGGMMFSLPDAAWLAIDVRDPIGNELDAVTITSTPAQNGGGALACNGTYTGTNTTTASPPCSPPRTGPMYFAYFDASKEVAVTASNTSAVIYAPVRVGEITVLELSGTTLPPSGGGGPSAMGTLSVSVEQGGSVTSSPSVITCSGAGTNGSRLCTAQVPLGTIVTLRALPDPGNVFDDWDNCINRTETPAGGTCILTIMPSQHIRAEFDPG